jgi:hypothetical protein
MAGGTFGGGDGTTENPYLIEDVYDLFSFTSQSAYTASNAKLVADLDFSGTPYVLNNGYNRGSNNTFTGSLDGDGYSIKYLTFINLANAGLFYNLGTNAYVKNIIFEDIVFTMTGGQTLGGLIAAQMSVNNARVENCCVRRGTFSGYGQHGMLIGSMTGGAMRNCYSEGVNFSNYATVNNVNSSIGGLVGIMSGANTVIANCYTSNDRGFDTGNRSYWGVLAGSFASVSAGNFTNNFFNSQSGKMIYLGSGAPVTIPSFNDVTFKDGATLLPLSSGAEIVGLQPWVIGAGDYPRLFYEKFDKFFITEGARVLPNIDFGSILEGGTSRVRDLKLRNGYGYKITQLTLSWARTSSNINTSLFISETENFDGATSPLTITTPIDRNSYLDVFAKIVTQKGMSGTGQFDITLTIDAVEM